MPALRELAFSTVHDCHYYRSFSCVFLLQILADKKNDDDDVDEGFHFFEH